MKILVVDTDDSVTFTLARGLTHHHHLVNLTSSGQTGLELARAHHYDVIVVDAVIADLDGLNFCRQLRAFGKQTPIVFLSSDERVIDCLQKMGKGANTCLSKTVSDDELVASVLGRLKVLSPTS
jgi:two-component system, OmpR family, response regulator